VIIICVEPSVSWLGFVLVLLFVLEDSSSDCFLCLIVRIVALALLGIYSFIVMFNVNHNLSVAGGFNEPNE
jgi:hypothetical protein